MNSLVKNIYNFSPHYLQNTMVSMYDLIYYKRHGGKYSRLKKFYKEMQYAPYEKLINLQNERFKEFFNYVINYSSFYKKYYSNK